MAVFAAPPFLGLYVLESFMTFSNIPYR